MDLIPRTSKKIHDKEGNMQQVSNYFFAINQMSMAQYLVNMLKK